MLRSELDVSKLIIPMYSTRSYTTGEYSILADGNCKLAINRCQDSDVLAVPDNAVDLAQARELGVLPRRIVKLRYGLNALASRREFWHTNCNKIDKICHAMRVSAIVSDISGYKGSLTLINNFNVSFDIANPRRHVDEFKQRDLDAIVKADKTYMLNDGQRRSMRRYLSRHDFDSIVVDRRVVSYDYYSKVLDKPASLNNVPQFDVFFPFRLSDPAYKFADTVKKYAKQTILVTDPNDSLESVDYDKSLNNVVKYKLSKVEYYHLLRSRRPTVVYNDDPSIVFHPGLADFIFFGCNIVSEFCMPSLSDVLIVNNTY